MNKDLIMITFEDDYAVLFARTWYEAVVYLKDIYSVRPDMFEYYNVYKLSGIHKYWYLFKYPYLKIK